MIHARTQLPMSVTPRRLAWGVCAFVLLGLAGQMSASETRDREAPPSDRRELREASKRPATVEEVGALLDVLRDVEPNLAAEIDKWRGEDPQRVVQMINRRFPRLRHLVELRRSDPPLYELRVDDLRLSRQTLDLVRQYRAATLGRDGKAQTLREQLRNNLVQQFEVRQQIRRRELEKLEERMRQMRRELEDRQAAREQILDQELRKLTEERTLKVESEPTPP